MKILFLLILTTLAIEARAESLSVNGKFILGKVIFDKGQDARLDISVQGNIISAVLVSPASECVFDFGIGKLEKEGKEFPFSKGSYAAYTLPLESSCGSMASNPLYLVLRRNEDGHLESVRIVNRSSNHRWTYFSTF